MRKLTTILRTGVKPLVEGRRNHIFTKIEVELLAEERKNICVGCPFYEDEPVDFLRISDAKIPELHHKMCGDCGCALPWKLRQSIETCPKWGN